MTHWKAMMRRGALILAAVFGFMSVAVPVAQAGMISVERHAATGAEAAAQDKVQAFLARAEVEAQLISLGVDPQLARERAAALSGAELAQAADLADRPAGAGVVGALAFIFVLLLITDIIGLTNVFTFVR
ncbi:MAG: PA2779 family protein [Thiohalobacteraceae bacterium]